MKVGKYDVTPKSVGSFIRGTSKKILDDFGVSLPDHEASQVILRATLCKPCLDAGQCIKCECKTPDMFYDPQKQCEMGKWGKMMDMEEWEKFSGSVLNQFATLYSYTNRPRPSDFNLEAINTTGKDLHKGYVVNTTESKKLVYDFEEVTESGPITHTFTLTNTSQEPIQIMTVNNSCGCTVSQHTTGEIDPQSSYDITIKYDNKAKGDFSKTSVIRFTSQTLEPIMLEIKGKNIT